MTRAPAPEGAAPGAARSSAREIFAVFLRLGLTSFGGPVAHLAFFRTEFVERRRWLDETAYADLVALCQFLPGPASSQVGMAVGLLRGGWAGALAAWLAFTLPSALLLMALALLLAPGAAAGAGGALHGLKLVAVAVVAQAVWGMARQLCPDLPRATLALCAAALAWALPGTWAQVGSIATCALLGRLLLRVPARAGGPPQVAAVSRRAGGLALLLFVLLLLGLPLLATATAWPALATLDAFYRAGALVFGGGHVVLPLLQAAVVPSGAVSNADFVAGYGAAQAVPGPLFTFAAYLGAVMRPEVAGLGGWLGGLACLLAIFVPAALLVVGAMPFWAQWRQRPALQSALAGVNAGVVGLLLAALYDPVWTSAVGSAGDLAFVLLACGLLVFARCPPAVLVLGAALAGWGLWPAV